MTPDKSLRPRLPRSPSPRSTPPPPIISPRSTDRQSPVNFENPLLPFQKRVVNQALSPVSRPTGKSNRLTKIITLVTIVWSLTIVGFMVTFHPRSVATPPSGDGTDSVSAASAPRLRRIPHFEEEMRFPTDGAADAPENSGRQNVVQFVVTPFQQGQANLLALGHARLELFKTFTLPSMVRNREDGAAHESEDRAASRGGFLWIIRTDPNLPDELREDIVELIRPYPDFFLIASTERQYKFLSSWLNTSELDLMVSHPENIWSGDPKLLQEALFKLRNGHRETHVTETRLDADDAINSQYLRIIREKIVQDFKGGSGEDATVVGKDQEVKLPTWLFFCAASHMQWFSNEFPRSDFPSGKDAVLGRLGNFLGQADWNSKECITPGLTVCIRAGTYGGQNEGSPDVPVGLKKHDRLTKQLVMASQGGGGAMDNYGCGLKTPTECLMFLGKKPVNHSLVFNYDEKFGVAAIRARAMTSAGMKDIDTPAAKKEDEDKSTDEKKELWAYKDVALSDSEQNSLLQEQVNKNKKIWNNLETNFGISSERIVETRDLLQHNLMAISVDALKGQCKLGHSCKEDSKEKLKNTIEQLKAAGLSMGNKEDDVIKMKKDSGGEIHSGVWRTNYGHKFQQVM
mmetsp:Transcript_5794/g.12261  ORF Transcript_5794/g.12261 Transcript_5794/m.12261 type:complete len:629 (-) Transcript_5794:233-2119(-)